MNVSLYEAAAAMNANAHWQEAIAENLSANFIPGFKKTDVSFGAMQSGALLPNANAVNQQMAAMPTLSTSTNFSAGEMKSTGVPTDVAIDGRGFFEVQLPDGGRAYTRDGEFHISPAGQLVTKEGYGLVSEGGAMQFDQNNSAPLSISANGDVSQGGDRKGRIKLVDFSDPQLLTNMGSGYFLANANVMPTDATGATVRQGYLEAGNTSSVAEMTSLITAMRMYEANQKVIVAQDERMSRAITELGNPS